MTTLNDYAEKYRNIRFERRDGILQVTLHTDNGPLRWGADPGAIHEQLGAAFFDVGRDRENRVMILTGTGDAFCKDRNAAEYTETYSADYWYRISREGRDMLMNLLDIDVPGHLGDQRAGTDPLRTASARRCRARCGHGSVPGHAHEHWRRPGRRLPLGLEPAAGPQSRTLLPADFRDALGQPTRIDSASFTRSCRPQSCCLAPGRSQRSWRPNRSTRSGTPGCCSRSRSRKRFSAILRSGSRSRDSRSERWAPVRSRRVVHAEDL